MLSYRPFPLNRGYPGFSPAFTRRKKALNARSTRTNVLGELVNELTSGLDSHVSIVGEGYWCRITKPICLQSHKDVFDTLTYHYRLSDRYPDFARVLRSGVLSDRVDTDTFYALHKQIVLFGGIHPTTEVEGILPVSFVRRRRQRGAACMSRFSRFAGGAVIHGG
jgi:hypothetical protein